MHRLSFAADRRGAAAATFTFLLPALTAAVGFAIDGGLIQVEQNKLQVAADAAATAGVRRVLTPGQVAEEAVRLAALNMAPAREGNVLGTRDVEVGTWNGETGVFQTGGATPNAVRVTTRSAAANGNPHQLVFGRVLGMPTMDLSATAIAFARTSCTFDDRLSVISPALPTRTAVVTMGEPCLPGSRWTGTCYWATPAGNPIIRVDNAFDGPATITLDIRSPSQYVRQFSFRAPRRGQFWVAVTDITVANTNSGLNIVFGTVRSDPMPPQIQGRGSTATYANKFNVTQTMPGTRLCVAGTERAVSNLVS